MCSVVHWLYSSNRSGLLSNMYFSAYICVCECSCTCVHATEDCGGQTTTLKILGTELQVTRLTQQVDYTAGLLSDSWNTWLIHSKVWTDCFQIVFSYINLKMFLIEKLHFYFVHSLLFFFFLNFLRPESKNISRFYSVASGWPGAM